MFDHEKLDSFFDSEVEIAPKKVDGKETKHTKMVRLTKLILPSIAAVLLGFLIIFPSIKSDINEFKLDITRPLKGELEKLHMENSIFYITDKDNKVNNFIADNIDETSPGSKLIKLNNPEGIIPNQNQTWISLKAPTGYYNQTDNTLDLIEDVELFYSNGMTMKTIKMTFDFNTSKAFGTEPVSGQGEIGDIQSEGFEFYSKTNLLVFTGKTNINIREESLNGK